MNPLEEFMDSSSFNVHLESLNKSDKETSRLEKIRLLSQSKNSNEINSLTKTTSIFGIIKGEAHRFFEDEINIKLRHNKKGIVAMANLGANLNSSTFYMTLADKKLKNLDDKHTIFGSVEEGLEILDKINSVLVDEKNQPYQNIRIKHTLILDDPFEDDEIISKLIPLNSPAQIIDLEYNRLDDDFKLDEYYSKIDTKEKFKNQLEEHEAKNRAIALTLLEDLPDADVKPSENVLFVCKLNAVTQDEDLEEIFAQFGSVKSCKIMRDPITKQSLKYAFIEFEESKDCEEAFFKMNGAIIDDSKIKVDFSQSVNKSYSKIKKVINYEKEYNEKNRLREENKNEMNFDNKKLIVTNKSGLMPDDIKNTEVIGKGTSIDNKNLIYNESYEIKHSYKHYNDDYRYNKSNKEINYDKRNNNNQLNKSKYDESSKSYNNSKNYNKHRSFRSRSRSRSH
jgi:peptidyl-prolyl cis-trans isomerase-like 4